MAELTLATGLQARHTEYDKFSPFWERCRTVVAGDDAIKSAGVKFIPLLEDETPTEYQARIHRAAIYEASDMTLDMLLGSLYRKPGTTNLPTAVEPQQDNIDLAGMPYDGFRQRVGSEVLEVGRFGVLVDYSAKQKRPFWRAYETEDIWNWSYAVRDGRTVLDQVVLYERVYRRARTGFGTEVVPQIRVLELDEAGIFQNTVYALQGDGTNAQFVADPEQSNTPTRQGKPFTEIPFVCFGRIDLMLDPQKPPLLAVCNLELDHYRLDVDLKHHLHLTALDGLFVIGDGDPTTEKKYYLGGTRANRLQAGADAKFVGVSTAWEGIRQEKESDEQRMALLGARMLLAPKRAAETAEALTIHKEGETARLSTISQALSYGLTRCWQFHVRWMGGDENAVQEELNRDFNAGQLTPEEIAAQLQLVLQGQLSQESFLENLYAGEISRDPDTEQGRLDAEALLKEAEQPEPEPTPPGQSPEPDATPE